MTFVRATRETNAVFLLACAIGYAVVTLAVPPYVALIEPDSASYIEFFPNRSALYPAFIFICRKLGLGFEQITWVQLAIFCLALIYLLSVLLRSGFPRILLALFVALLAANILFSSFHRSILTESIYYSLSVVVIGQWVEYFSSGRVRHLVIAGILLGLMMGLRPVALSLVPMQVVAVLMRRPEDLSRWFAASLALFAVGAGVGTERLLYHTVHQGPSRSTAPLLFMGKAAMLIGPDMKFSGPHADVLQSIGGRLYTGFRPLRDTLENAPSLAVRVQLGASVEGLAQDEGFMRKELLEAADQARMTIDDLRSELGKQVMLRNPVGYLKLVLVTEVGQWSVAAQRFPPTAAAIAAYSATAASGASNVFPEDVWHPQPWRAAWIVYPGFLAVGAVTLVLALALPFFLVWPDLGGEKIGPYLRLAVFFSAMCHLYTLFISLANVWTPRFLMAVFPQLVLVALCLLLILVPWLRPTGQFATRVLPVNEPASSKV